MNTNGHTRSLWQRLFGREEPPQPKPKEMQESWPFPDWMGAYQELFGRLTSRDGWWPLGVIAPWQRKKGFDYPFFNSEHEHALLRSQSRILCGTSTYAKGLIAGYAAYVLGDGLTYRWRPKDDAIPDLAQLVAKELQKITDAHMKRNQWHGGEQPALEDEFFRRAVRDGEPILVHFPNADGSVDERFCEPDQLRKPLNTTDEEWSFGIHTHPNDVSNPLGYWICWDYMPENGEEIPPERVVHMRRNVDRNVKRGLPDFIFHTASAIDGADKLLAALMRGATIQASIAGVRQHEAATIEQVESFRDGDPQAFRTTNPVSGKTETNRQFYPGEVWDIPKGLNFVPPPGAANVDKHIQVLDAALRSAGRPWNAPEWLSSGDASNNNYSSSLTAESPFVLRVKKEQNVFGETLGSAIKYACQHYCEVRGLKLGNMLHCSWEEVEMLCELKVTARSPIARDPDKSAASDKIYVEMGSKSRQMVAEDLGYEWEKVERDNEEYTAAHPAPMMPPGGGPPGQDGQQPGQEDQGPPNQPPPQGGPPAQMQEWLSEGFDPTKHPRGKDGKFIPIGELVQAMHDPRKADELRAKVHPEDRAKLERRINPGAYKKQLPGLAGMGGNQPSTPTMARIKGDITAQQAGEAAAASGERARMQVAATMKPGEGAPADLAAPGAPASVPDKAAPDLRTPRVGHYDDKGAWVPPSGAMDLSGQPLQNRKLTKAEQTYGYNLASLLAHGRDPKLEAELAALAQGATIADAKRAGEAVGGDKPAAGLTDAELDKALLARRSKPAGEKSAPPEQPAAPEKPVAPAGLHPAIPVHIRGDTFKHQETIRQHGGRWDKELGAWVVKQNVAQKLKALNLPGISMHLPKDQVKFYHPERITESVEDSETEIPFIEESE